MPEHCGMGHQDLSEQLLGLSSRRRKRQIDQHLQHCASCRMRLEQLRQLLDVVHNPQLGRQDEATREQRAAQAIETYASKALRGHPAATAPRLATRATWWTMGRLGAVAGTALVVALVVVGTWWLRGGALRPSQPTGLRVAAGSVESNGVALRPGDSVVAQQTIQTRDQGATLQVGADVRLEVARATQLAMNDRSGQSWRLEKGRLTFDIRPIPGGRRLSVDTPEATTMVLGTRFSLHREPGRTSVQVERGRVKVIDHMTGDEHVLEAGQERVVVATSQPAGSPPTVPSALAAQPPQPASQTSGADPQPVDPRTRTSPRRIRRSIRAGDLRAARVLLRRAKARNVGGRSQQAELAIVAAEIYLAEKQYGKAIEAYLKVSSGFRGTAQAETALFTAAQLILKHQQAETRALELLQRHLRSYPAGRYRQEVRLLHQALLERQQQRNSTGAP